MSSPEVYRETKSIPIAGHTYEDVQGTPAMPSGLP